MTDLLHKAGKQWEHDELLFDLARHVSGKVDRMIWTDCPMGPAGSVRPDLYSMAKSYTRPLPISYEVKISVADFRSDVTSGKWQAYLDFSAGVAFAAPRGMVEKADLPRGCGLMVRSEKTWRTLVAPKLDPCELPVPVLQKLLIDGMTRSRAETRAPLNWLAEQHARNKIGAHYGREIAEFLQDADRARDNVLRAERDAERILENARETARSMTAEREEWLGQLRTLLDLPSDAPDWRVKNAFDRQMSLLRDEPDIRGLRDDLRGFAEYFDRLRRHPLLSDKEGTA